MIVRVWKIVVKIIFCVIMVMNEIIRSKDKGMILINM